MSGEHEAQLGHSAAETGFPFDEVYVQAGFREVNGGSHTPNAAAHHKYGAV
jgi:hypothetical protein